MNIVTSLLRSFGLKRAVEEDYPGTWVSVTGMDGGVTPATLLEANKEWVFVAVDKVASSVAGIRFKVMRYAQNGDDRELFQGPLIDFLEKPSPAFTGKDFIYLNTVWKELTGNAFWERIGSKKVNPLVPTRISPILSHGELVGFKYNEGTRQRTIPLKDVLHDRYADPAKPWWGVSKLQKIGRWVDTSSYATEFVNRFFSNGATFGGFLETDEESEERIKLIKAGLRNDHVGVANAHKLGVLPKGTTYKQTTANMAEIEMGATEDRFRDKILAAFGVPKTLVGLTTEVNRASAEASEYIYAKYTIKPIVDDLVEFLNTAVVPMLDSSGMTYFAYDDFIPVDADLKRKERESALAKQPYMTVNEVRASVGLPPVEGGDVVQQSPLSAPLGTPSSAAEPENDNEEDEDEEPKKALPARARASIKRDRLLDRLAGKAAEIAAAHHDPDEASHKAFVGRVEEHEKLVAGKVRDFNNRQERDVTQRLKQITKAVKKGDILDMDGEVAVLVDFVSPMLKGLMVEQAIAEYVDQGFPGTLDQNEPRIRKLVESAAKRLAKSYNATTVQLLAATLNEGLDKGEDLTQLTSRVKQVYEFSDQVRAVAVARTEAFYIANEGSREAFRQSGVVETMRWYTADSDACQYCGPQNGKTIGVSEVFFPKGETITGAEGGTITLDYRAIDVPPLHPNCRCFIRPERIAVG